MKKPSAELLSESVAAAIQKAMTEILSSHKRGDLFGFALCTDNDLSTVYHVFASRTWVAEREKGYPEIGYIAVEWTQAAGDEEFLRISEIMRLENRATDATDGRNSRFNALVAAMRECRNSEIFDRNTLLLVGSTDPDDQMLPMEKIAIETLNEPEIAAAAIRGL